MPIIQIHDVVPSKRIVVGPRAVLKVLGERAMEAWWQVSGVTRYDDAFEVVGSVAANRLEALSQSKDRVPGSVLDELISQTTQIIWGEFRAYIDRGSEPWLVVRAIDSSWCEVETDDKAILDYVGRNFSDVRVTP